MTATEFFRRFIDPEELDIRPAIPLSRAMLCMDCDAIFSAEGTQDCPSCASTSVYAICRVLDREPQQARPVDLEQIDQDLLPN